MKNNSRFGQAAFVHYRGGVEGEEPFDTIFKIFNK